MAACRTAWANQLRSGLQKIQHCVGQLDQQQLWWRPAPNLNSIANLLLHLEGNVRQWLVAGLLGLPDMRARQQEFDDRSQRSAASLLGALTDCVEEACQAIMSVDTDALLQERLVQEFPVDGLEAIANSVSHFCGHVQEIVLLTRMQCGKEYQFAFVPQSQD